MSQLATDKYLQELFRKTLPIALLIYCFTGQTLCLNPINKVKELQGGTGNYMSKMGNNMLQ